VTPAPSRRQVWRAIVAWGWRASPRWTLITAALLVAGAVAWVLYPVGIAVVIDGALARQAGRVAAGAAGLAGLYAITWTLGMLAGTAGSTLSDRTWLHLTTEIIEQLGAVEGVEHLERPAYRTELELLQENLRLVGNGARQMLVVLQVVVRAIGIVVVLALIDPPLALLPLLAVAPILGERRSVALRQRTEERLAPDRRLADELFALATNPAVAGELRVFGAGTALRERHRRVTVTIEAGIARAALLGGLLGLSGWLLFAAGFVAGIVLVVVRAVHGAVTVGEVVLAVTLIQRAQLQIGQAAASIGQMLTTVRHAERLIWLQDYAARDRADARSRPRRAPPARLRDGIELRGVRFTYPERSEPVLDGVDLRLPAGRAVALVGENGAGKTTLVKLLTGMYRPDGGQVLIDGVALSDLDLAAWRSRSAAAFQDFVQFELLAREAVGVGDLPRIEDTAAVQVALERAAAGEVTGALTSGLMTPLGRSFTGGQELSGGQWQRLALARGMMRDDPLLLILDEPTASLDALTEAALFERYLTARRQAAGTGAITLLVSHRFSTVRMADLIVVLQDGRVAACGDHAALVREGGLYAELYEMQARAYR
jgi:ATP-binding cassette subfamily B protein